MSRRIWFLAAGALAILGAFGAGIATGHYKTWPFWMLWSAVRSASDGAGAPYIGKTERSRAELFRSIEGSADIVMLGDSLTEQGAWQEHWPRCRVFNRGISGDTIHGIERRLDEVLGRQPKTVVLLAGGNDLNAGTRPELIVDAYRRTLARLTPATRVVAISVLPCSGPTCPGNRSKQVQELNAALKTVASEAKVQWIDLFAGVARDGALDTALTYDGHHLNGDGYRRFRRMISPVLGACAANQGGVRPARPAGG